MNHCTVVAILAIALVAQPLSGDEPATTAKPLLRDFIGVNGHTIQFKPELYKEVCSVVRDYHPLDWDTGPDSDYKLDFPFARNRVSWEQVYGSWRQQGFYTDVCVMFETLPAEKWKSLADDSLHYGRQFATSFGPSSKLALVDAVEIGNEPGKFTDEQYRTVFENMAKGFRQGDNKLKVATCNVNVGPSGDYHKSVECIRGLEDSYDILNIHTYALLEGWPTWKRSFPEDPVLPSFTQDVDRLIAWRNEYAPGKEVWLTEFGWDCSTGEPPATGDFSKWLDNTDTEQAQWLVRALLLFAKRDIQRAFIYFFNDDDTPQFHGASGLTRKFVPKPSFYAVSHLYKKLGNYRFSKVIRESTDSGFIYEFANESNPDVIVYVAWSPTGSQREFNAEIELEGRKVTSIERMPLTDDSAEQVAKTINGNKLNVQMGESPLYISLTK